MFSPHLYIAGAPVPEDPLTQRAASILLKQERHHIAPVLTLWHLTELVFSYGHLRQHYAELDRICHRTTDPYSSRQIHKHGRKRRTISDPIPLLKTTQRWILRNILDHLPNHPASFAYQRGRSAQQCATRHLGAKWAIRVDIESFFNSFTEVDVYGLFRSLDFPALLAFQLSRLCTREVPLDHHALNASNQGTSAPYLPYQNRANQTVLPQGAPTSGALANLLCSDLDDALFEWCSLQGFSYTRYSDDLWISGSTKQTGTSLHHILRMVEDITRDHGLHPNVAKRSVRTAKHPIEILGLRVDLEHLTIPSRFFNRISSIIHSVERHGIHSCATKRGMTSLRLEEHILGLISYVRSVEQERGDSLLARWHKALGQIPPS